MVWSRCVGTKSPRIACAGSTPAASAKIFFDFRFLIEASGKFSLQPRPPTSCWWCFNFNLRATLTIDAF